MKIKPLFGLAFWLAITLPYFSPAQGIYVSTVTNDLYQLELQDCNVAFVVAIQHSVNDISFHPNGKLYGIGPFGEFFEISITTGAIVPIHQFTGQAYNSLTVHSNGRIYATGSLGNLWSYDLTTGIETLHGNFGFGAAGDLTFYRGELYVAAIDNNIIAIDIDNPTNSQVIIDEDFSTNIYGIVSFAEDCNTFNSYAITGGQSKIYEIDFENNQLNLRCELNISIGGGASTYEFLASYSINVDNAIEVYPSCTEDNGAVTLEASGGDGALEYSIDGINFQSSNTFLNLAAEAYTFIIRDENDCRIEYEVDYSSLIPSIEKLEVKNTVCNADNGSITIAASGGIGPLEYSIDGINFQSNPVFENLAAQAYTITVQNQNACKVSEEIRVSSSDNPELLLLQTTTNTCNDVNGKIEVEAINGTPPYTFSIAPLNNMQSVGLFENLAAGSYQVNLTDGAGCKDFLQLEIKEEEAPFITKVNPVPTSCGAANGSVAIDVNGGIGVQYSIDQNTYQNNNVFNNLAAGNYRIQIQDRNNCSDFAEFEIAPSEALQILSLEAIGATCGEDDGELHIEVEGNQGWPQISINQEDFSSNLSYLDLSGGFYQLLVQDDRACQVDSSFTINQERCPVYIPNAFSPNGDGNNDLFRIYPHANFQGTFHSLNIFNRWGGLVYQLRDLDPRFDTWDGRIEGKIGTPEVYTYYLEMSYDSGETEVISGTVSLMR